MYINLRLFRRALSLALFRRPFRLRRFCFVLFFTGLYLLMWLIVACGRALDHLFFPGFKRQPVREPVFVIAPPRSGTTLTQKLLAQDDERFACVRLYETIFPAITFHWLFKTVGSVDLFCGRPLERMTAWIERRFFGGWDDMHKLRFNQPEEDDGFFVYPFMTEAIYLLFPYVRELWGAGFCDDLPLAERRKVMRYYRSCLQRHLYAVGTDKVLLSKATQFSGAVLSILDEFPDARIITIVRDPAKSIASHVSLFYHVWQTISPDIAKASPESRAYAELAAAWFRHMFHTRERMDPRRYYAIRYADLVRDPVATIQAVYTHFGFVSSPTYLEKLIAASQCQQDFRSKHQYSLEEFGLDVAWLREQVGEVIDFYGLESTASLTGAPAASTRKSTPD